MYTLSLSLPFTCVGMVEVRAILGGIERVAEGFPRLYGTLRHPRHTVHVWCARCGSGGRGLLVVGVSAGWGRSSHGESMPVHSEALVVQGVLHVHHYLVTLTYLMRGKEDWLCQKLYHYLLSRISGARK